MSERSTPVAELAQRLREAYETGRPVAPLAGEVAGGSLDDAYAVQDANTERWLADGRRLVGRKIGLTSVAVQQQLGVDQPDFGMLFADMGVLDGDEVAAGRLLQPRVEAEVAFVLDDDLDDDVVTIADVIGAVAYALPAIEIVDSRIADWKISIVDTIADNASSGAFVLGTTPRSIDEIDLHLCGMVLERDGEQIGFGAGAACLGNPLHALAWLATAMVRVGRPLRAGDLVLSGALGPMTAARPGDRFEARISGLGSVGVAFAPAGAPAPAQDEHHTHDADGGARG